MKFEDYRKRVKDLRPCDYGEGQVVGYVKDGQEFWIIRWDDSGLDNEWLERREFEFLIKECAFCHHGKGYHLDESLRGVTQLPCNFTWEENGLPVSCLCYGWCETKEEADKLAEGK
jgi:hypothetical protein